GVLPSLSEGPDDEGGVGAVLGRIEGEETAAIVPVLRNLEQRLAESGAHTILVTSALPREERSATAIRLAAALARAGRVVAFADFDTERAIGGSAAERSSPRGPGGGRY